MAIPPFTRGYPPDGSSLGNTKSTIRDNLDGEFLVVGVDHQTQNTIFPGAAGSHTKCSLKNTTGSTTPTLPPGIFGGGFETLYSQPAGAAPLGPLGEIFYSRAGGTGIQLTGPGTPTKAVNGYTFLAGGIVLQWGFVASIISGNNVIPFLNTFSTAVVSIQLTPINDSANVVITVKSGSIILNTSFTAVLSPAAGPTGLYWIAIGY